MSWFAVFLGEFYRDLRFDLNLSFKIIIAVVLGADCSSGLGFSPKSQMMVINPEKCLTPSKLEEVLLEGIGVDSEHREGGMGLENVKKIYKCER